MAAMLIFSILSILSVSISEDRAHGLANETPMAISPQAYAFFHPNALSPTANNRCDSSSKCSTLPLAAAATVQSTPAHKYNSPTTATGDRGLGAGGIAGISLSFLFVCLVGMGIYYVTAKRRANLQRANSEEPADV